MVSREREREGMNNWIWENNEIKNWGCEEFWVVSYREAGRERDVTMMRVIISLITFLQHHLLFFCLSRAFHTYSQSELPLPTSLSFFSAKFVFFILKYYLYVNRIWGEQLIPYNYALICVFNVANIYLCLYYSQPQNLPLITLKAIILL